MQKNNGVVYERVKGCRILRLSGHTYLTDDRYTAIDPKLTEPKGKTMDNISRTKKYGADRRKHAAAAKVTGDKDEEAHISSKSNFIRDYSIPLIAGVIAALLVANFFPSLHDIIVYTPILGKKITFEWLVNEGFMTLFFASAGIAIVNSMSPGGAMNPIKKAVTPLMATFGGVLGPIAIFFILNSIIGRPEWSDGWGICTATDIALAWLIAKVVFGKDHPAVTFLLLLAVADDAIGLVIIAVFYPTPGSPVRPLFLLVTAAGIGIALLFNKKNVRSFWPYILIAGGTSWIGLFLTGVSPALALVVIIPFLPRKAKIVSAQDGHGADDAAAVSTLGRFEKGIGPIVDYGLFFFGFANAGVAFTDMSTLTLIVMVSLIVGKTMGISLFAFISAKLLKFGLPTGMKAKEIPIAGIIGGVGLTVALFVSQAAYTDMAVQSAAKMGALFSIFSACIGICAAKLAGVGAFGHKAENSSGTAEIMLPDGEKEIIPEKGETWEEEYPIMKQAARSYANRRLAAYEGQIDRFYSRNKGGQNEKKSWSRHDILSAARTNDINVRRRRKAGCNERSVGRNMQFRSAVYSDQSEERT